MTDLVTRAREAAKLAGMKSSKSHSYVKQQARVELLTEQELANDNHGFTPIGVSAQNVVDEAREKMKSNAASTERKAKMKRYFVTSIFIASLLVAGWVSNELWANHINF